MKNQYKIKGDITEIYVKSPKYGLKTVLIDTEDLELVSGHSWCLNKNKNIFYCISNKIKTHPFIYIHRLIMQFPKDKQIDHINHNGLDNRKCNLRICTNQQNSRNQKKKKDSISGFKGVVWDKEKKKWKCQIKYNNKQIYLGYFTNKIEAAKRYDKEAIKLFGEFALLNFPKHKGISCIQ